MSDPSRCAAMYVRMSTEHQQYSTSNQQDAVREYAQRRGFEELAKIEGERPREPGSFWSRLKEALGA